MACPDGHPYSLDAIDIAQMLDGQTIANIEGVLQYALDQAVARHQEGPSLALLREHLQGACRMVLGGQVVV